MLTSTHQVGYDVRREKTYPNVFVVVIPKEGWAWPHVPILLLVWHRLFRIWVFWLHRSCSVKVGVIPKEGWARLSFCMTTTKPLRSVFLWRTSYNVLFCCKSSEFRVVGWWSVTAINCIFVNVGKNLNLAPPPQMVLCCHTKTMIGGQDRAIKSVKNTVYKSVIGVIPKQGLVGPIVLLVWQWQRSFLRDIRNLRGMLVYFSYCWDAWGVWIPLCHWLAAAACKYIKITSRSTLFQQSST